MSKKKMSKKDYLAKKAIKEQENQKAAQEKTGRLPINSKLRKQRSTFELLNDAFTFAPHTITSDPYKKRR